jgi:MerR family transcriptional regulator, thiopeptide resistance regulator
MDEPTTYSVGDLARLSGVTVRTLHHYDRIGLLVPSARSTAGYREYSTDDAARLGQILAYRACGLELAEITVVLAAAGIDRSEHLRRQLGLLDQRMAVLTEQRRVLATTLEAMDMGIGLDPEEMLEVFGDHDPRAHADEARERWGDTDAYRESHRRTSAYTKEDWLRMRAQADAVETELEACLVDGEPADGERAKAAAEAHRRHIDTWFYPCSYDMQVGLADMYVQDPRFRKHYDDRHVGLADYVHDAIMANALDHIA